MWIKEVVSKLYKKVDSKGVDLNFTFKRGDTKKEKTINKMSNEGTYNQIDNSGLINSSISTTNNFFADCSVSNISMEKENKNDEQLFYKYFNCLNLKDLDNFLDTMISGSVWGEVLNDKIFNFLELVTDNDVYFFFDKGLEERRLKLVESCSRFLEEFPIQSGTYSNATTFSLKDEDNDEARLQERIRIMKPLSIAMRKSYEDFIMYARKEKKYL